MKLTLQVLMLIVAIAIIASAWIGLQVAFPLFPAVGAVVRRLPEELQMFGILSLLGLSVVGTCYFSYSFVAKRRASRREIGKSNDTFSVTDPRFND